MLAEVEQRHPFDRVVAEEFPARLRHENLTSVSCRADPGGSVYAETYIAFASHGRLAGVDSHAHAQLGAVGPGVAIEGDLPCNRGADRILRPREGDEEGVALVPIS